jgi:hypothetical protein
MTIEHYRLGEDRLGTSLGALIDKCVEIESEWGISGFDPCWYRGHSSASYELKPELYRAKFSEISYPPAEYNMLMEFVHRSPAFVDSVPSRDDTWDWVATARHHGLPSRLMDWSLSPMTGLFFALEKDREQDADLWMLNPVLLNNKVVHRRELFVPPRFALEKLDREDALTALDRGQGSGECGEYLAAQLSSYLPIYWKTGSDRRGVDAGKRPRDPVAVMPQQTTRRIHAQNGAFTCHGSESKPLDEIPGAEKWLCRITIPGGAVRKKLREAVLRLSSETMAMPELEYLCKELTRVWTIKGEKAPREGRE